MLIERFGPPSVMAEHDLPRPAPAPGEALVRVHACGVNRMDTELRAGTYGGEPLASFFFGRDVVLPHLPGIEPAGEVVALGAGVTGLAVGERVVPHSHLACGQCGHCLSGHDNACASIKVLGVQTPGRGGYAEYLCWPAARLIRFDAAMPFAVAAAVTVNYGPVWCGLVDRAGLLPGETLLVTGAAGGCGHAALDLGRLLGARVIAVTRSASKVAGLRAAGADEVIVDDGPGWHGKVLAMTNGAGADVVCELVGAASWADSVSAAAQRGRVVVIGSHGGLHAALNLGEVFGKNLAVLGVTRASQPAMTRVVELAGRGAAASGGGRGAAAGRGRGSASAHGVRRIQRQAGVVDGLNGPSVRVAGSGLVGLRPSSRPPRKARRCVAVTNSTGGIWRCSAGGGSRRQACCMKHP